MRVRWTRQLIRMLVGVSLAEVGIGGGAAASHPNGDPDLVLEYHLDEGSGTLAVDTSGSGLHGALEDTADHTAPLWAPGHPGSALEFDGIGDLVAVDHDPVLNFDRYTLMAWVRYQPSAQARLEVLEKIKGYWMNIRMDTRRLRSGGFYGGCDTANWVFLDSAVPVPEDVWTHVATTYDGAQLKVYVDGQEVANAPVSGALCTGFAHPLVIGAKHSPLDAVSEAFFRGSIDEVRVYRRALAVAEILQAAAGDARPVPALSGWSLACLGLVLLGISRRYLH